MRIALLLLASFALIGRAFTADIVAFRFSKTTISAINEAHDCKLILLKESPPNVEYDKIQKKPIFEHVFDWLDKKFQNGKSISDNEYKELTALLLNSDNHYAGMYAVGEPAIMVIRFKAEEHIGYIVLHNRLVVVYWGGRSQSALLNENGSKVLQQWIKENG